jgi:hypothetical protein
MCLENKVIYNPLIKCIFLLLFLAFFITSTEAQGSEWLYYDEGGAVHAGSSLPYQGVRFSLPGDSVRAPLLQVAFFYSTKLAFCPVKIHITDHSHSTRLADRINYDAVNGWNYLDVSLFGISVPHNFYVIMENRGCGSPMLDNNVLRARSFKGNYLKSMKTCLSHDLLIRAEIGEPWEIPILKEWNVSISEKLTIKQAGTATQKMLKDFGETWTLYAESSLAANNNIYGIWKQKGQKFQVSLDPEEVRKHLIDTLSNDLASKISDVIVAKISFTGKAAADETIRGTVKIYAKISFFDSDASAKVTIERKFTGIPVALQESVTAVEQ